MLNETGLVIFGPSFFPTFSSFPVQNSSEFYPEDFQGASMVTHTHEHAHV